MSFFNLQIRLRPSRRIIMTLSHDGHVELTVAHVTKRDAGFYTCAATNEVGKSESVARVKIDLSISSSAEEEEEPVAEISEEPIIEKVVKPAKELP